MLKRQFGKGWQKPQYDDTDRISILVPINDLGSQQQPDGATDAQPLELGT